jgi:hypothetical protein
MEHRGLFSIKKIPDYPKSVSGGQTEAQAGVAVANFLLTKQGDELITQAGFVKSR